MLEEFAERAHLHGLMAARDERGFEFGSRVATPVDGADDADFRALSPAYLRFTSGTTSRRKGVILGHDAVLARLAAGLPREPVDA